MSDADVISACLQSDPTAQHALYETFLPYVLTVVRRYGFAAHEEPDCIQEAFIEIFDALPTYDAGKGSLKTWIRTIAVRRLLKVKRTHYDSGHLFLDAVDTSVNCTDYDIEYLLLAIARLPTGYCLVFNLFEVDGYSHAEIAKALDISEASSRSQLSRAKERLRHTLAQQALKHA